MGSAALQNRGGWPADAIGQTADETIEALRRLWSGASEYTGKHVSVSGALPVLPVSGRVPIWVGGAIRCSAVRAARLGDGWYGGVNFRLSQLLGQTQAYRAALGGGVAGTVAVNRVTLVAATASQLDDLMQRHLAGTLKSYARSGESLQQVADDVALVGTPSQITAQLERYRAAGVSHVFARLSLDDMPPEVAGATLELFGREVIPTLAA